MKFIEQIAPIIVKEAKKRGYKFPSAIIAQACLESNYGKSSLASNYFNYFGMKCGSYWKGKSVNMWTKEEFKPGTMTTIKDNFRVYDSMEAGVRGYFDFIATERYKNLKEASSPRDYLAKIKADGYATAATYVDAVMSVISNYNLIQYDKTKNVSRETSKRKSTHEIALEVIHGEWGNGQQRKDRLTKAGYNYDVVQKEVNQILERWTV